MSDVIPGLRSTLEPVKTWITLGSNVMHEARKAKGLSYEAVGRLTNVSSKTYERYEKAGRVPAHQLEHFADVLGLDVEMPPRQRVVLEADDPDAVLVLLRCLDMRMRSLESLIRRM